MPLGFFTAEEAKSPEAMALRQRLALQMMQQRKFPKNVGEGIADVGSALGERFTQQRLDAQMAALERASANRGVRPAALPSTPPAVPGSTDPATGAQSAAPAAVQTAAASPFPDVDPAAATATIPAATLADVAQAPPPQVAAAPPVQDASVAPPQADAYSYPQTAAADTGTVSDAPPVGIQPAPTPGNLPVRNALAQQVMAQRQGGPQPNPMLAGQSPASMPSTLDPASLGSPLEAADNRPIEMPNIQRFAQVGGTGVKLPGQPAETVPDAPMVRRPGEMNYRAPVFEKPPRMADPGPQELDYLKAASDPMVLPSYQKKYAEEAARLAEKRKYDHDQAMEAFKTRDALLRSAQERASGSDVAEYNRRKLADEEQARQRTERISRAFGPGGTAPHEKAIEDSYKNVAGLAQQNKAINQIQSALADNKMFTGSAADLANTRAKIMHAFGYRLDPRVIDTERFATLMAPIVAANRRMISGNQNISDKDVEAALKASGGDPKLERESLLTILKDLQEGSLATAIEHQRKIRDLTGAMGEKDYEARLYNQRGVPNLHQLVPQSAVDELYANPDTKAEFDDTFHTPGLADLVLRFRQRSK